MKKRKTGIPEGILPVGTVVRFNRIVTRVEGQIAGRTHIEPISESTRSGDPECGVIVGGTYLKDGVIVGTQDHHPRFTGCRSFIPTGCTFVYKVCVGYINHHVLVMPEDARAIKMGYTGMDLPWQYRR
jgi:hypothetical protein